MESFRRGIIYLHEESANPQQRHPDKRGDKPDKRRPEKALQPEKVVDKRLRPEALQLGWMQQVPQVQEGGWGQGPVLFYNTKVVVERPGYPGANLSQGHKAVVSGQQVHTIIGNLFQNIGIPIVPVQDGFDIENWDKTDGTINGLPVVRPICFQRCAVDKELALDRNFSQHQNVFRFVLVVPVRDDLTKRRLYFIQTQRQHVEGSTIDRFEHILSNVRDVCNKAENYWGVFVTHFEGTVREGNEGSLNDALATNPDRTRVLRLEAFHHFVYHVMELGMWIPKQ